jgi:hypothetical protein
MSQRAPLCAFAPQDVNKIENQFELIPRHFAATMV